MIKLDSFEPDAPNEADVSHKNNEYTGRYLVSLMHEDMDFSEVKNVFQRELGLKIANTLDFEDKNDISEESYEDADMMIFNELGVAVVGVDEDKSSEIMKLSARSSYVMEPEEIITAPNPIEIKTQVVSTWGIKATKVDQTHYTGKNVKVAVLDTGFDFSHPDFVSRNISSKSFVPRESADDINGHGTHCIGTACGNTDNNGIRYGVAKDSDIYVGKVLGGPRGSGTDSWILNGINWAVVNNCKVINMSLGSRVFPGQTYKLAYERAAKYALKNGSLIIASAGNDSQRPFFFNPIGSPANSPSILAVAAVDVNLHAAKFSNRAINPGSRIEISGPGVNVRSSWITSVQRYKTIHGTSMATPHVSGIAALYAEQHPNASPLQLWNMLTANAQAINGPAADYGAGLVIAP